MNAIIFLFLISIIVLISGCTSQPPEVPVCGDGICEGNENCQKDCQTVSGAQELVLNEQDLQQLGMTIGTNCVTEEYQTNERSPLEQYIFCNYTISSLNDTEVIIELKKYTNLEDLNGSYQYDSLHLRSSEGLISEDVYGDQSRFSVNHENDYMGHLNKPDIYYYHLWIVKDFYLIHITSKGSVEEARDNIEEIGLQIFSKLG